MTTDAWDSISLIPSTNVPPPPKAQLATHQSPGGIGVNGIELGPASSRQLRNRPRNSPVNGRVSAGKTGRVPRVVSGEYVLRILETSGTGLDVRTAHIDPVTGSPGSTTLLVAKKISVNDPACW